MKVKVLGRKIKRRTCLAMENKDYSEYFYTLFQQKPGHKVHKSEVSHPHNLYIQQINPWLHVQRKVPPWRAQSRVDRGPDSEAGSSILCMSPLKSLFWWSVGLPPRKTCKGLRPENP